MVATKIDGTKEKGANGTFGYSETSGRSWQVYATYETTTVDNVAEMAVGGNTTRTKWFRGRSGEVCMGMDDGEIVKEIGRVDEGDSLLPEKMRLH